jgi:hypothetical protein
MIYKFHNCIGPREETVIIFIRRVFLGSEWLKKCNLDRLVILKYINVLLHLCEEHDGVKFFFYYLICVLVSLRQHSYSILPSHLLP